ncbi:hypothetical protein F5Y09DRAFT_305294 [Xylaria sp. FL1042]|nr:hypothetical protein F5Y09DRAFT_305294 [Xylaria sp. FL1042]
MSAGNFIRRSNLKESFDQATGQTFLQWDVPAPKPMPVPWNRVPHFISTEYSPSPPAFGAAPLVDICSKVAAQHIEELDKSHLQDLPTPLVSRIWEHVRQTSRFSVETWKLLAGILATRARNEKGTERPICEMLMTYSLQIPQTQPLAAYIEPLVSDTLDFLTHLVIAGNVNGGTAELLQLVQLKNLAVLEIIAVDVNDGDTSTFPRLTDSVVREWSTTPGAFPFLRVLKVWGEDHTTRHSLRYIDAFPSLVVYDVAGRKRDWARDPHEIAVSAWKSTRWTWTMSATENALRYFDLFNASIPNDKTLIHRKLFQGPELLLIDDVDDSEEIDKALTELEIFIHNHSQIWFFRGAKGTCYLYENSLHGERESREAGFWGFLMYCYIGKILSNRDLSAQGLEIGKHTLTIREVELPPRPMMNIMLGNKPSYPDPMKWNETYVKTHFETQLTFVRYRHPEGKRETSGSTAFSSEVVKRSLEHSTASNRPLKKRQDAAKILESFING